MAYYHIGSRTIVQAGITGLQLKHKDAQKGILLFFDRLIQLPTSRGLGSPEAASTRAAAQVLVGQCGGPLVTSLCSSLANQGQIPAYALNEDNGCCGDVLWSLKLQCPTELQVMMTVLMIDKEDNDNDVDD
jgi:hypothetical protein